MSTATKFKTLKDIPKEEYIAPGNTMCAGCGGILAVRIFHKALGPNVAWVNAAGCMTISVSYPLSPLKSNWLYTAFASAPAGAQGIRDALDVLMAKGKLQKSEDLKVVVVTGDGAAYDIGFQSTAGAIQRDLDFYYLCYDNEAYGNTGFQMSSSTPYASSSKTTPVTAAYPYGNTGRKKDLFEAWRAMKAPYVATLSNSHGVDFLRKVEKGEGIRGPKLYIDFAACPTGWGFDPKYSIEVEKLAVQTGVWPLKESVDGVVRHTYVPRALTPVREYLRTQERYGHLFKPVEKPEAIATIQRSVNDYWAKVAAEESTQATPAPA
ncbi:MAG: pyruvate synthase [Nitrososphaerota archaeon]|jgi:pyruvate ferredoxin oxidoreductase beta subunit|nr:pyruvate synthase [Nitrososphaerota archaeon]MDG6941752.1 pyruvate synthase [Nitrososphaerota archaeon]MDG6947075.1 pyruvate synthase [Nitrososphaerota archaeon]MDG6951376.1 pyruvate synthase [Nitrososphaerota archaeon]